MTPAACTRTRSALGNAVGEGISPPWPLDRASSAHLDVCVACRTEAEGLALATHALHRFASELGPVEPPATVWPELKRRASRERRRRLPAPDLVSIALAMSVVTAFVVKGALPGESWQVSDAGAAVVTTSIGGPDRRYDPPVRGVVRGGPYVIVATGPASVRLDLRLQPVALDRSAIDRARIGTPIQRDQHVPIAGFGPA